MSRFFGRAIAALAVWVGLAMLGFGPRASASFLPFATQDPQPSSAADGGNADNGPAALQEPAESQQDSEAVRALQPFDSGTQNPVGGGAGSTSSTSSSSAGQVVMLTSGDALSGPTLSTRLRSRDGLLIPDPIIEAILDPPRVS